MPPGVLLLQGTAGYARSLCIVCSTLQQLSQVAATNGYMVALRRQLLTPCLLAQARPGSDCKDDQGHERAREAPNRELRIAHRQPGRRQFP